VSLCVYHDKNYTIYSNYIRRIITSFNIDKDESNVKLLYLSTRTYNIFKFYKYFTSV